MGTWEGLGLPRLGEYEQEQQNIATDMVTLAGATSMTGDFFVCKNSLGTERFVIESGGNTTVAHASSNVNAMAVNVTSSGAIALGTGALACGFLVSMSSKANINAAFAYSVSSTTVHVGACEYLLMSNGSKAPDYFLGVSASTGPGIGAIVANGFLDDSLTLNTFTCDHPFVGVKCMAGSVVFYLLGAQATGTT